MEHMIYTLEDIKNKLRSSGGIGGYGLGQKISSRDFMEFWDPKKKGIQLIEMGFVIISKSTTNLAGIETVALRNLNTANRMYAGKVHCEKEQYSCQSRRSIGMHRYRSTLDTFASFQATTQAVCRMQPQPTPYKFLISNSEALI